MATSHIWGMSSTTFMWAYVVLSALALAGVWLRRRSLLDGGAQTASPRPFDAYELAMLNGGPQLAMTIAAANLHRAGALTGGAKRTTMEVRQRPDRDADGIGELEEELFDAVQRNPGMPARTLRDEIAQCAPIRRVAATLTADGLLLDESRRRQLRRLALWLLPPIALGVAVTAIGADDGVLRAIVALALMLTAAAAWLALQRPRATRQGRQLLDGERNGRKTLGRVPSQAEIPAAVALYGAGALWLADPSFAAMWAVPREHGEAAGAFGRGGGGCGAAGGGGCGGGGCGGGGCGSG